ncbi:hypothetical protein [Dyadobacter psychrotolerans]|uniref:DUF2442 domain-containing protein n=1 Tax=Dyadobacter psychrotolerans TaxID=2541721 RepID=A0A4R5DNE5_9BACT|nr:hypothetical protein [Dyadobacter psychrotolerans]TDE12415.1 hypothetical protein E0F88_22215 [Dyadobacter psychrotolerans]
MNPRVRKIVSVSPFTVDALWTNNEVRRIDFSKFLSDYFDKDKSVFFKILNEDTFMQAKTDGRTIYWEGLATMQDYDGNVISAPLDFCPDVLFEKSVLVS